MAVLSSDQVMVERSGVLHKTTAGEIGGLGGGGGGSASFDNIVPSVADVTDKIVVRRGAVAPNTTEVISDITPSELVSLKTEITEARGQRTTLNNRISTISNFASPNAGGVIPGQYYDNAFHATGSALLAGGANRCDMSTFYTSIPMRIEEFGVAVTTGVAGATGKFCIYGSDNDGWPDQLLYEGPTDQSFDTVGYAFDVLDFVFDSGRQYWLGVRHSSNAVVRACNLSSSVNLGMATNTGVSYYSAIRRGITYANPLPANWGFVNSDRALNVNPISFRMKAIAF